MVKKAHPHSAPGWNWSPPSTPHLVISKNKILKVFRPFIQRSLDSFRNSNLAAKSNVKFYKGINPIIYLVQKNVYRQEMNHTHCMTHD